MPSVSYDYIPNQVVWVITGSGVKSGTVTRVSIEVLGTGTFVTYYVRLDGDRTETAFDESDVYGTCQASHGYQIVDFGGTAVLTNPAYIPTGSPLPATITSSILVDNPVVFGTSTPLVGNGPTITFADIINGINGYLGGYATAFLEDGNIKIQSSTKGATSAIDITDVNLFNNLQGFVQINAAVPGDADGAMEAYASGVC